MAELKAPTIPKDLLALAGEHRVASELCRRGVFATITPGNRKQTDIYVVRDSTRRLLRIEVKASQHGRWVTRIGQRKARKKSDYNPPDFWVFVLFRSCDALFFVLTNKKAEKRQRTRNKAWHKGYRKRHKGKKFDPRKGVDNLILADVADAQDSWDKIVAAVGGAEA